MVKRVRERQNPALQFTTRGLNIEEMAFLRAVDFYRWTAKFCSVHLSQKLGLMVKMVNSWNYLLEVRALEICSV